MAEPEQDDFEQYKVKNGQSAPKASDDEFSQYRLTPDQPGQPRTQEFMAGAPQPESGTSIKEIGKGLAKGAGHTLLGLGEVGENLLPFPGAGAARRAVQRHLAPEAAGREDAARHQLHDYVAPKGPDQELGYGLEQAGEFLVPLGAEEKLGTTAGELFPKAAGWLKPLVRAGTSAVTTGGINKLHGGSFAEGAIAGGVGGVASEGLRAAAPAVAEAALSIPKRMRGYGRTPGAAALEETRGIMPATIRREASAGAGAIGNQINAMAAAHPGTVSLRTAIKNVDDGMKQAIRENNQQAYERLSSVRGALTKEFSTGQKIPQDVPAPQALDLKRGLRKQFVTNWNPEVHGNEALRAAKGSSGAVDRELDTALGPKFSRLNQRYSSLAPIAERAESLARDPSLFQRVGHRVAAHTGAATAGILGGLEGYRQGGVKGAGVGALAGIVAPELVSSAPFRMAVARSMYSPVLPRLTEGALLEWRRRQQSDEQEPERQ